MTVRRLQEILSTMRLDEEILVEVPNWYPYIDGPTTIMTFEDNYSEDNEGNFILFLNEVEE